MSVAAPKCAHITQVVPSRCRSGVVASLRCVYDDSKIGDFAARYAGRSHQSSLDGTMANAMREIAMTTMTGAALAAARELLLMAMTDRGAGNRLEASELRTMRFEPDALTRFLGLLRQTTDGPAILADSAGHEDALCATADQSNSSAARTYTVRCSALSSTCWSR